MNALNIDEVSMIMSNVAHDSAIGWYKKSYKLLSAIARRVNDGKEPTHNQLKKLRDLVLAYSTRVDISLISDVVADSCSKTLKELLYQINVYCRNVRDSDDMSDDEYATEIVPIPTRIGRNMIGRGQSNFRLRF